MTDPKLAALIAAAALALLLLAQRKSALTVSCIGVFLLTHTVFVALGLLILPFAAPTIHRWFPAFALTRLTATDQALAIVIAVGGMLLVFLSYHSLYAVLLKGRVLVRGHSVLPTVFEHTGYSQARLLVVSGLACGVACVYLMVNIDVFVEGVRGGILSNRPDLVIAARRASTSHYLYVVLVYNVLPFMAVGLWLYGLHANRPLLRAWSAVYTTITAVLLLLVFQKRPLIVFLGALFVAHHWCRYGGLTAAVQHSWSRWRRFSAAARAGVGIAALFALLLGLYYTQTQIGRGGESTSETLTTLATVAVSRIIGRLSLPSVMYVHYFPDVQPHYGFSNIGMLSRITGADSYTDTRDVFGYFTQVDGGSVAVPALFDFYGAFGLVGWFAGACLLGMALAALDFWLRRLPQTVATGHAVIFLLVSVFYLSQASVARTLMGYGALFFVTCWLMITKRTGRSRPPFSPSLDSAYPVSHAALPDPPVIASRPL